MFNIIYCDLVECKVPDDIIFLIFEYLTCASMDCNEYGNNELTGEDVKMIELFDEIDLLRIAGSFHVGSFYCSFHYEKILKEIEDEYYYEYCCEECEDYGSDGIYERFY
tara:strand:+ start:12726 stop:13052 length:327 start_codon:yes stop_codon:yes gene_type:complete